jgi:hypothetical protein
MTAMLVALIRACFHSISGSGEREFGYQRQVSWCADVFLLINHTMDAFSDDIFSVFDESDEERVPTAKSEEKQSTQVLKTELDVK